MSNLGPRPVAEPALRLSAARSAVLAFVIDAAKPVTVAEVAESSGQHTNTIREHLDALVHAGLVARATTPPSGRGRPAIAYSSVGGSSALHGTKEYAALVDALVEQLKRTSSDVLSDALAVGRTWAQDVPRRENVTEMLRAMGFDSTRQSEEHLLLETCPVLAAAKSNPEVVCHIHLGLLREVAGEGTQLEPFIENGCMVTLPKSEAS